MARFGVANCRLWPPSFYAPSDIHAGRFGSAGREGTVVVADLGAIEEDVPFDTGLAESVISAFTDA
ncbi:hypothetical protein, partial [Rathayibacter iranicus]|uniref:hypothetical protein n=2 Tax=Rathayibacter iranicus TaxID=59737 RepID=UPI001B80CA65